jgi:hypothetical protein
VSKDAHEANADLPAPLGLKASLLRNVGAVAAWEVADLGYQAERLETEDGPIFEDPRFAARTALH